MPWGLRYAKRDEFFCTLESKSIDFVDNPYAFFLYDARVYILILNLYRYMYLRNLYSYDTYAAINVETVE